MTFLAKDDQKLMLTGNHCNFKCAGACMGPRVHLNGQVHSVQDVRAEPFNSPAVTFCKVILDVIRQKVHTENNCVLANPSAPVPTSLV